MQYFLILYLCPVFGVHITRHKADDDYILTTKLFCGYCGVYMCGEAGTGRSGEVYHYYKCVSVKKERKTCHKKSVKKDWIEDIVINEVQKRIESDSFVNSVIEMVIDLQEKENTTLPLLEKELSEIKLAIHNILNAMEQEVLTKSTKIRLEELEARQEELEIDIDNEKMAKPVITPEFIEIWLKHFRVLDINEKEDRKTLIDSFVNKIYLYDDKLVIGFTYGEEEQTVTFSDLQESFENMNNKQSRSFGSDMKCSCSPKQPM